MELMVKKRLPILNRQLSRQNRHSQDRRNPKYRIILFSDMQKAPVQLEIPVWVPVFTVLSAGLLLLVLLYYICIFSHSSSQLSQAYSAEKQLQEENVSLKQMLEEQKQQVEELQLLARQTQDALEDIYASDQEIRSKLGIETHGFQEPPKTMDTRSSQSDPAIIRNSTSNSVTDTGDTASSNVSSTTALEELRQEYASIQPLLKNRLSSYSCYSVNIAEKEKAQLKAEAKKEAAVSLRNRLTAYALEFVGNPYVYGGNNPNSGVDCSGFTRYVLSHSAGVSLRRTAAEQSTQGKSISIDEARPGDLLFYGDGSSINHVALYIGDGKVVHASTEETGIIVSPWNYRSPVKIKDVIGN